MGAKISAPVHTGPGSNPASYKTGTGLCPGVEWPGCSDNHPRLSSDEVTVRIQLHLYCPSVPSWRVSLNFPYTVPSQFTIQTVFDLFCKAVRCRLGSVRLTGSVNVSFWTDHSTDHSKSRAALCTDDTL